MKNQDPAFDHSGSSLDSLLKEEGILDDVDATAIRRVDAWLKAAHQSGEQVFAPSELNRQTKKT